MESCTYQGLSLEGFHTLHYTQWGEPNNRNVVVCVHGLTRNCRDFDYLARALEKEYRVVCVDIVGRGQSAWLTNPANYTDIQYLQDLNVLLARINGEQVTWIGTSMGGLLGMALAAQPGSPIQRLVINDIGPVISKESLIELAQSLTDSSLLTFKTLDSLHQHLREDYRALGDLSDAMWEHLLKYDQRQKADGSYTRNFDPAIFNVLAAEPRDHDYWAVWESLQCPMLLLRGEHSPLLSQETYQRMQKKPLLKAVEIANVGHPVSLMLDHEIAVVKDWLANL